MGFLLISLSGQSNLAVDLFKTSTWMLTSSFLDVQKRKETFFGANMISTDIHEVPPKSGVLVFSTSCECAIRLENLHFYPQNKKMSDILNAFRVM
jgi:hypothetical protein